jgi:glutamate-1-semialdehyde 2,1-aminomutase
VAAEAKRHGVPIATNRVGSMFTWFFRNGKVHNYDDACQSDTEAFSQFHRGMLERRIYLPPSQFEAVFLSAAHSEGDISRTIEAARGAFETIRS